MVERDADLGMVPRRLMSTIFGLALIGGLSGCQTGGSSRDDESLVSGGYPSLRSVPVEPRPSAPIEERRRIVRELIEERDRSRQLTNVVRRRSGLGAVAAAPASSVDALGADKIIPDAPDDAGAAFRLTPNKEVDEETVYREEATQFEDGSLGDFIRQLKQNTLPSPAQTPGEETEEDDLSFLLREPKGGIGSARLVGEEQPILLAAFAPVLDVDPSVRQDVGIRLAADDEESSLFCDWVGFAVAWAGACLDETETVPEGDPAVGADLQQDSQSAADDALSERSDEAEASPSGEEARERAERRLSEEDAVEAIEDAGRSALAPIASSLDKLRDFIRSRQSNGTVSSSSEGRRALRTTGAEETPASRPPPPIPGRRPEMRENVIIVEDGETFDFNRTPRPAFKPSREEESALVILPPEGRPSKSRTDRPGSSLQPQARPEDLRPETEPAPGLALLQDEGALQPSDPEAEIAEKRRTAPNLITPLETRSGPEPSLGDELSLDSEATSASLKDQSPAAIDLEHAKTEPETMVITFEPGMQALPEGVKPRLETVLADAKARDQKIFIIGEASTNYLAKRRATDVGAALVQLGATVEILEYDHDARADVDRVRLVLKSAAVDPLFTAD